MNDIVSLAEVRLAPVPEVVELLEALLDRARSGEVRGLAVATACAPHAEATAYALGDGGVAALVLSVCRLHRRLLDVGEDG